MSGSKYHIADLGPGWDTHCHVFDPITYPYASGVAYTPPRRTPDDLMRVTPAHVKSVIVMSVPEGDDTRQTEGAMAALKAAGRVARGTIVGRPDKLNVEGIRRLHSSGVRSIRYHILRYKSDLAALSSDIERTAQLLHRAGVSWGIDMQLEFARWVEIAPLLATLHRQYGTIFIADHLFCCRPSVAATHTAELERLFDLVRSGTLWVKVSGLHRYSQGESDGYKAFEPLLTSLVQVGQGKGLISGSDWPHVVMGPGGGTSEDDVDMPAHIRFIKAVCDAVDEKAWQLVWHDNAESMYA